VVVDLPVRLLLSSVIVTANLAGGVAVTTYSIWLLPKGPLADPHRALMLNLSLVTSYLMVAVPLGVLWGALEFRVRPSDRRRRRLAVVYAPLRLSLVQGTFWLFGTVLFGAVNSMLSRRLGLAVAEAVLITGISICALSYLLAERILRRSAIRALDGEPPRLKAGVLVRSVLFWALGTAVPVVGLLMAALSALIYRDIPAEQLATTVLVVGGAGLIAGFLTTVGAARAVADPVRSVRGAMQQVAQGLLDVSVPVYDAGELGQLQAGFNQMSAGLRERDRIRDLFGRQVGFEVASASAAATEVRLGGDVRQVAVLFVDLVGSTALADGASPTELVGLLNRFFGVVVEVVEANGGWINKFEGDAALAVFGAPNALDDAAGHALAAGRHLAERLTAELPDLLAGIGVSAGDAVAGYVGDVRRYEYTVIGDPVNEAARLTELAKTTACRLLAAGHAVAQADDSEAAYWVLGDTITLRGRTQPTLLAGPMTANSRPGPAPELGSPDESGHHQ
jgi:adenylate cyclase